MSNEGFTVNKNVTVMTNWGGNVFLRMLYNEYLNSKRLENPSAVPCWSCGHNTGPVVSFFHRNQHQMCFESHEVNTANRLFWVNTEQIQTCV